MDRADGMFARLMPTKGFPGETPILDHRYLLEDCELAPKILRLVSA